MSLTDGDGFYNCLTVFHSRRSRAGKIESWVIAAAKITENTWPRAGERERGMPVSVLESLACYCYQEDLGAEGQWRFPAITQHLGARGFSASRPPWGKLGQTRPQIDLIKPTVKQRAVFLCRDRFHEVVRRLTITIQICQRQKQALWRRYFQSTTASKDYIESLFSRITAASKHFHIFS